MKIERAQQLNEFNRNENLNSTVPQTNSAAFTASNNKSQSQNSIEELENNEEKLHTSFCPVTSNHDNNLYPKISQLNINTEYDDETENEIILNNFQVDTLRQLIQLLGKDTFHKIAYNTVVGNQVIVHGKYERLVSSIIRIFEV